MEFLTAGDLYRAELPPVRFVVDGLVPEGLTLLLGDPKMGKSFFGLQLASAVASGSPFLGKETLQGHVLYLALEDSARRIKDRLNKQGPEFDGADAVTFGFGVTDADAVPGIVRDFSADHPDTRLIVIDTFGRIDTGRDTRGNEYQRVTMVMGPLQALATELGIAIVLVHHLRKRLPNVKVLDPFQEVLGSQAIFGIADTGLLLISDPSSAEATLHVRGRDVEPAEVPVRHSETSRTWRLRNPTVDPWPGERGVRRRVLVALAAAGESLELQELKDRLAVAGHATASVSNALTTLTNAGLVHRIGQGLYSLNRGSGHRGAEVDQAADEVSELDEPLVTAAAEEEEEIGDFVW